MMAEVGAKMIGGLNSEEFFTSLCTTEGGKFWSGCGTHACEFWFTSIHSEIFILWQLLIDDRFLKVPEIPRTKQLIGLSLSVDSLILWSYQFIVYFYFIIITQPRVQLQKFVWTFRVVHVDA